MKRRNGVCGVARFVVMATLMCCLETVGCVEAAAKTAGSGRQEAESQDCYSADGTRLESEVQHDTVYWETQRATTPAEIHIRSNIQV